jgi:magnesium chelatase family protein
MLVGDMNPCPCGFYGDAERKCSCAAAVTRYQKRISGPLLDRIAIHMEVPRVDYEKLTASRLGEPSAAVRDRVEVARARQQKRFAESDLLTNADMRPADVRRHCQSDDESMALLRAAIRQLRLSARAFHRILKPARTISDLAESAAILHAHIAFTFQYRSRRRH